MSVTVAWPASPKPISAELTLVQPTRVSVTHSLARQVRTRNAGNWTLTLEYPPARSHESYGQFMGILASMCGQVGKMVVTLDETVAQPNSTLALNPQVDGAGAIGDTSVNYDNANSADEFKAGDLFSFQSSGFARLHMLTADSSADGSGTGTLNFQPPVRAAIQNNEFMNFHRVGLPNAFVGSLLNDDAVKMGVNHCAKYGFTVDLIEVDFL